MNLLWVKIGAYVLSSAFIIGIAWLVIDAFGEASKVPGFEAQVKQLKADKEDYRLKFNAAKQISIDAGQTYENIIADRDTLIVELSRRPERCIPVYITTKASKPDAANKQDQPGGGNGIPDTALYQFAAYSCEPDRGKVTGLQQFINDLYKLNEQ